MAGLEEKLCPVCFQEAMEHGECRNCGYHAEESSAAKDYLAPFTILKEKYLLGKSLGQGGFGITYLAENMQSGLRCCIKEYFPSGLLQGRTPDGALILADEENRPEYEEGKQQFIEEACALQELRENISVVDIRDFFEENGTAYFAMELIEGCNLRVFRKNHNPKQTLKMALQMLFLLGSSLAEVHRFGMIHGDISPENILITQDGEIKLIDFGAARSFRQGSDSKERKIYLKPNYAPYEQYTQKPCQGPWTDIYALAATFYFIVSGRKMLDALSRAKGASYPPLHELCPAVSRQLSDVIDKALAFDYHDRYRRMLDFLDALEQVVRPEDYDIDLGALMPKSKASKQAEIHVETSDDSEKMCQVEEQNMPEPKGLAAFFHPKKRRLAYLELTMRKSGGHISRRRWIIEPNRTVKVGRLATSDVMMPADNQISRNHCEVFYNEPQAGIYRQGPVQIWHLSGGRKANGKRKIVYTERWRYFLCRVARVHIQGGD